MDNIIKAQDGAMLASTGVPKTTPVATPPLKPYDALKLYSQYSQLKYAAPAPHSEQDYRNKVASAYQKYNGKQITDSFSPIQKQNIDQLKAKGENLNYCISGTCRVLNDAGDKFTGEGNIDGIYFGNETAQQDLGKDGYIQNKDINGYKRGDILQLMTNVSGRAVPEHAMAFDSYIKDATGKVVGMRTFQNHGDGKEEYTDIVDDPKYHGKGNGLSSMTYQQMSKIYDPTKPLQDGQYSIQAWTKDPAQFAAQDNAVRQQQNDKLQQLRQQLINFNPAFSDDEAARKYFTMYNNDQPRPQQLKLYADGGSLDMDEEERTTVKVGDRTYHVIIADDDEKREDGLQYVTELPYNEGMLFVFDEPTQAAFWMKDTYIPLDIIYATEDGEIVQVWHDCAPMDEDLMEADRDDILYVLEVNAGSGIQVGEYLDFDEDFEFDEDEDSEDEDEEAPKMLVLNAKGKAQMELQGGERIFSRPNTKTIIRMAKRAYKTKSNSDYKALGKKIFAYLDTQNNKEDDYVELPD